MTALLLLFLITVSFLVGFSLNKVKTVSLFWLIIFIPTIKLLPDNFLPLPGMRLSVIMGFVFVFTYYLFPEKEDTIINEHKKSFRYVFIYLILSSVFLFYQEFKEYIITDFLVTTNTLKDVAVFGIRLALFIFIFYKVSVLLNYNYYRDVLKNSLLIGIIIIGISTFFGDQLVSLGINIVGTSSFLGSLNVEHYRNSGLYRGHPTQYAAFLSMGFGFALALLVKKDKTSKWLIFGAISTSFIGILHTGTRAGAAGVLAVVIFYIIMQKDYFSRKLFLTVITLILLVVLLLLFGDYFLFRFESSEAQLRGVYNPTSRFATWGAHILFFLENPQYWLIGSLETVKVTIFMLAPHSTLLSHLVFGGIIFFYVFYKNLYNIYKVAKRKINYKFNVVYPLLAFFIPSLGNDNFHIYYLPYILMLGLTIDKTEIETSQNEEKLQD